MCVFTPPECSPCLKTTRVPAYYISLELHGRKNLGCAILLQELLLRDAGALLLPRMLTSGPGSSPFSESTQGGWQKYKEISDQFSLNQTGPGALLHGGGGGSGDKDRARRRLRALVETSFIGTIVNSG